MSGRVPRRGRVAASVLLALGVAVLAAGARPARLAAETVCHLPYVVTGDRRSPTVPPTTLPTTTTASATPTGTATQTATQTATATPTVGPTQPAPACGAVETFADGLGPSRYVHVAPDGDDAGGDGSLERPFASIGRAARAATPGTAVVVHAGTYPGGQWLESLRGRLDAPIWIGGAAGEPRPVLEGGGEGLHLVRPSYVVLHDLEVRAARNNGVNVDDGGDVEDPTAAHHFVAARLSVHDIGGDGNQDCLKISGVYDFVVVDGEFARCGGGGSGSGIDVVGGHRGVIARCAFQSTSANGVQAKGGTQDLEVRWGRFADAGHRGVNMGGSTGLDYFRPPVVPNGPNAEARDVRVLANVFERGVTPFAFVGCVECVAAHNTVIDPERWLARILQETTSSGGFEFEPARDGLVANNLFVFERRRLAADVNVGPGTAAETFLFAHNLWHARDDPQQSGPRLPGRAVGGVVGLDPLLGAGFALAPGSPAIGAGMQLARPQGDLVGACFADPPSIGAREGRVAARAEASTLPAGGAAAARAAGAATARRDRGSVAPGRAAAEGGDRPGARAAALGALDPRVGLAIRPQ